MPNAKPTDPKGRGLLMSADWAWMNARFAGRSVSPARTLFFTRGVR